VRRMIKIIPIFMPSTELFQYVVMPDHIHFLIYVKERLPLHLGLYISEFKNRLRKEAEMSLFEAGFNDQILTYKRKLDSIFNYIRENPYRLMARRANRNYFSRCDSIKINGRRYTGYGNLFLLKNPFCEAVIVHSKDIPVKEEMQKRWLHLAESGSVMASAFISPHEKAVRDALVEKELAIIQIEAEPLPGERFKPSGRYFEHCSKGKLLILAPYEREEGDGAAGTRAASLRMNALAEYLADKLQR
ncbi:MAG: hypothetical protein K2L89_06545, partial [Muribaculaceae bacterium]|nr:hypothetical protein [Muribaculaceae bacterium]